MVQMRRLCLVVANDPRSSREAIAFAIQHLRPNVEVIVVDPADRADQVELWRPHMVISSVPVARAGDYPLCWVALYPAGKAQVVVKTEANLNYVGSITIDEDLLYKVAL